MQTGWRIGEIEIDITRSRVSLRGRPLEVDRSGYDLLLHLVEHAGRVVDKEALLSAGWPGRIVAENTLAKSISKLRHALGDDDGSLIRAVHGYGYRLAHDPEPILAKGLDVPRALPTPATDSARSEARISRPRWHYVATALALLLAGLAVLAWLWPRPAGTPATTLIAAPAGFDVIAVLPFQDRSGDGSLAMLADGLAVHLRNRAQMMPGLRIVNPGEVQAYRGDRRGLAEIARELGANLVVGGEVSRQAGQLHVVLQVYEAGQTTATWSRTFERLPSDQATLHDDIVVAFTDRIGSMPARWKHDPARGRGTANREAYLAFLRAATLFNGINEPNSHRRALRALEQAIELDPNYADAWLVMGGILGGSGYYADNREELVNGRQRALEAINRGIELAPADPGNYLLRSEMRLLYRFDWTGAQADIDAARQRTPGGQSASVYIWEARYLASLGRIEEAIALDAHAIALNPLSGARRNQGWHYLAKGDTRNARAILTLQLEDLPDNPHTNFYLALCDIFEGQPRAALARLEYSSTLFRLLGTTIAQHELGDRAASDAALAKLTDQFGIADGYWVGAAHAWRGEREQAFDWLERAASGGDSSIMYLGFDPLLQNLRGDPRFAKLLARLQLPADAPAWRLAKPQKNRRQSPAPGLTSLSALHHGSVRAHAACARGGCYQLKPVPAEKLVSPPEYAPVRDALTFGRRMR
jgi:serine/threonine-protein kinase